MSDIDYVVTENYEMKPDVYGGPKMDQHIPAWNGYVAGDKQDDTTRQPITFDPKDYPPGTKITVETPICPKCHDVYENCMVRSEYTPNPCNFDWHDWAECQYS